MLETMSYVTSMGVYILLLFLFLEYTREKQNFYKWFFILALFAFPLWFSTLEGAFRWAKTISVLVPLCFVSFVRMSNDGNHDTILMSLKKKWPLWILYLVLNLNIVEASLKDISLGNYANAIAGFILCVTIPLPTKHWRIGKNDGKNSFAELIADLPLAWCLLYVTWNAAFVYGENHAYFASSVCILIAPEIWMFAKKRTDLWLMGRIYTLGLHIFIRSLFDVFHPVMNSTSWFNHDVWMTWGYINLGMHVVYLVYWFFKLRGKDYVIKHSAEAYGY